MLSPYPIPVFRLFFAVKAHIPYNFVNRIDVSGPRLIAEVNFDYCILKSRG